MSDDVDGDWIYVAGSWYDLSERRSLARAGAPPSEDDDVTVIDESATVNVADCR